MAIASFSQLMAKAKETGPKAIVVMAPHEPEILLAARDAEAEGIAEVTLVGDADLITALAAEHDVDISRMHVLSEPDPIVGARKVMELLRTGQVDLAMKGKIETGDFLRAALDREAGLRMGRLFSHVAILEMPTLEQKMEIVQNAITVAQRLGIAEPKVAILAATEMVNPKIPTTVEAATLAKMADRGQIQGGIVDGPLALDNAISPESAAIKGIHSPVAGCADILVAPDVEAGNMLVKAITYFAKGRMAGVVVGAKSPLVVASRSDPHETKLISMALGVLLVS